MSLLCAIQTIFVIETPAAAIHSWLGPVRSGSPVAFGQSLGSLGQAFGVVVDKSMDAAYEATIQKINKDKERLQEFTSRISTSAWDDGLNFRLDPDLILLLSMVVRDA